MADISKISLPNGDDYDLKDSVAREHAVYYGTCSTAGSTVQKDATVSGVTELYTGLTVAIKFTAANAIANPTLKVNSLDAKAIKRYGTTAPSTSAASSWNANSVVTLTYDGTYWQMHDWNNTTYSAMSESEMQTGTATTARNITAARLKQAVEYHAPVTSVNNSTGDITVQPTLVSGTNIKTVNGNSLLGSGNINISGGGGGGVFFAELGITSFSDIQDAILAQDSAAILLAGDYESDQIFLPLIDYVPDSYVAFGGIATFNTLIGTGDNPIVRQIIIDSSDNIIADDEITIQPELSSGTNIKTVNNTSLLGSGNISIGGIAVGDFEIVEHSFSVSSISSGGGSGVKEATFTKAGYFPLALVGFQSGENDELFTRFKLTNQTSGSCKLSYYIRAVAAVSATTGYVDILWVKE